VSSRDSLIYLQAALSLTACLLKDDTVSHPQPTSCSVHGHHCLQAPHSLSTVGNALACSIEAIVLTKVPSQDAQLTDRKHKAIL